MAKKAIILLSGGLDSATCLALALQEGYLCHTLTFDYGQSHRIELVAAKAIAEHYGVQQIVVPVPLAENFVSSLLGDSEVPKDRRLDSLDAIDQEIPSTYVPCRNMIFLSIAAGVAESLLAEAIYIGVNSIDYSGYPDCRPEFIATFEKLISVGTRAGVEGRAMKIVTPLLRLNKAEIIRQAVTLAVPLSLTRSCYAPQQDGTPCGHCDSCQLRAQGFARAGVADTLHKLS